MPRKCCVPACKGNYLTGLKVSTFHFPRGENLRQKWIRAIHRQNFIPSEHSVVCELHFHDDDIERMISAYDEKTGKLITAPLDRPRLKKDAVPCKLPGGPAYLSTPSTSREHPEDRRQRLENAHLNAAIMDSLQVQEVHTERISLRSLEELNEKISDCELHSDWVVKKKDKSVFLILIKDVPYPKVICHVIIDDSLRLSVHINDVQVKQVREIKFPVTVSNTDQLSLILSNIYVKFSSCEEQRINDDIQVIDVALDALSASLPEKKETIAFLKEQVSLFTFKKTRARYSCETIVFWSLVHSISPHCYRFLRSSAVMTMPCPVTLHRICSNLTTTPVVEQDSVNFLRYLTHKAELLNEQDKTIFLMMDEIHIKPQLDFKGGNIVGQSYEGTQCASSAFVFMIRSLDTQYTDVAHIMPVKSINAYSLFEFLKCIILKLETIGFEVVGIVSDNSSINRKAVSHFNNPPELKIKYDHPNPNAGSRPLYFVFDSVHILKCIRNNWLNQKEQLIEFPAFSSEIEGGIASMQSLKILHGIEKDSLLKYANSLTLKSLFPSSIERQNVKLALQVFSSTTSVALRELGPKKHIAYWKETATFIEIICKWWDVVNVKTLLKGQRLLNKFQEPITVNSFHITNFLTEFSNWLDSKSLVGFSKQTHLALKHTTLALVDLAKYWLNDKKRQYFLPGKVQTDDLEDRFGKYRQMSGGNYHISVRQMFETESKLRVQSYLSLALKSRKLGDIVITKDDVLRSISDVFDVESVQYPSGLNVMVGDDDIQELAEDVWPVLYYISGYCAYSVIKKTQCEYCKMYVNADADELKDENNSLITVTSRGGLCYPSQDVVTCLAYTFALTQKVLNEQEELFLRQKDQRSVMFSVSCNNVPNGLFLGLRCTAGHSVKFIQNSIVYTTVNILLNDYVKRVNDVLNTKSITTYKRLKSM